MRLAFHPGHGDTDPTSWRHYLTEPLHTALLTALLVLTDSVGVTYTLLSLIVNLVIVAVVFCHADRLTKCPVTFEKIHLVSFSLGGSILPIHLIPA